MRLLFITNGYKPYRWAGTETYTAGIAEELARRNHRVEVICIGEWDKGERYWNGVTEDIQNGVQVRRINLNWTKSPDPFRYLYDNPVVAQYLETFLQGERFDLVHVTSCETLSASVIRAVKALNVPVVLSLTDFWFLCPRINLLRADGSNCNGQTSPADCLDCKMHDNRLYRRVANWIPAGVLQPILETVGQHPALTRQRGLRGLAGNMKERKAVLKHALTLPDRLFTASMFVKDIFAAAGVRVPITVQPYGHDLSWLRSYPGKSPSAKIRFGYVGQLIEAKGVHLILQAMREIPPPMLSQLSLVIYGNLQHTPSYGQYLKDLATHLPNVTFAGTYQHADSAAVFSGIDVLLVPSVWFDFPLIIHEAFATATPVIATNLGGMAEVVIHNQNGLLFERGNVKDLGLQLMRLLQEPELLERLRRNAPSPKSIQAEVSEFETAYIEIQKKHIH